MLDTFGIITETPPGGDIQIFNSTGGTFSQVWQKPRGATMLYVLALGAGGAGGAGATGAAGTARAGGGGGASGGMSVGVFPTALIPDRLWISVPTAAAAAGGAAIVSVSPTSNATNYLITANGGGAGTAGTSAAVGQAGISATIVTLANCMMGVLGVTSFLAGQAGAAGGAVAGAAGPQITIVSGFRVTGGNGGAGTTSADFAGGFHVATVNAMIPQVRPVSPAAGSNPGGAGFSTGELLTPSSMPLYYLGGQGGSSSNAGVGGRGGDGAIGCGGGGGGGGTTGGAGGLGGPGLVVIVTW